MLAKINHCSHARRCSHRPFDTPTIVLCARSSPKKKKKIQTYTTNRFVEFHNDSPPLTMNRYSSSLNFSELPFENMVTIERIACTWSNRGRFMHRSLFIGLPRHSRTPQFLVWIEQGLHALDQTAGASCTGQYFKPSGIGLPRHSRTPQFLVWIEQVSTHTVYKQVFWSFKFCQPRNKRIFCFDSQ